MPSNLLLRQPVNAPNLPRMSEPLPELSDVRIRPIRAQDGAAQTAFLAELSPDVRRFRLLGHVVCSSEVPIKHLSDVDFISKLAFVAVVSQDAEECIVAIARYSVHCVGDQCECTVIVADTWRGRGLETLLVRHLLEVARTHGIHTE